MVSPVVANPYMEEVEVQALTSFTGTTPNHWFRYVDNTWVKIRTKELETFSTHLNKTNIYVNVTEEDVQEDILVYLDWSVKIPEDRNLTTEVDRKPKRTDQ